ncbi:(Fe-S)-binding protein [Limosilactobacillus oris]|uniref:(Fe-S)-binding protein n=1 Tax=Limosilactobacillus oris TaxID=1632 RepID=UPI0024B327C3|nr:(Fe-S)-binding protein [Limosilactobacillus oris]WHO86527.1 (Fe-S)-binding protein [Limosilactobacillus oris]
MNNQPRVCIFSSCLVDLLFPNVGKSMVEVLERLGCQTFLPDKQVCCGQPTYNSGYAKESLKTFKNEIDALLSLDADYIVGPTGSCVFMIKEYKEILQDDPVYGPRAAAVADKIYEFSQFIYRVLGVVDCGAELDATITVHRSCHMTRLLGERTAPFVLLDHVKGIKRIPLHNVQLCCGFGGTFSAKEPELSTAMVADKAKNIMDTKADILVGMETSCLMNIAGYMNRNGQHIKVMHIAEVLNHDVDPSRIKYLKDTDEAVVPANGEGVF